MSRISYRVDIDGLRALAVMAVIFCHLDIHLFKGGFIGVDIFFVISGFLITALLHKEFSENGSINLGRFFWRRMQRLYPATVVTAVLTVFAGFLLFSNEQFTSVVWSSVAAIFSYSNIFFWNQVGYFDAEAATKPLLHTWSLGVEEQFYLFWPLTVLALLKFGSKKVLIIGIFVLSLLSFAANGLFIDGEIGSRLAPETGILSKFANGKSSAFYLFPFRIFEFGMGGLLSLAVWRAKYIKGLTEAAVILGLAVILFSTVKLGPDDVFPYYNALIVSGATLLLLWGGATSVISRALFTNAISVFIGQISYSLYLVHWPIIVYWKYLVGGDLRLIDILLLLPVMLVVGYFLHIGVEKKFRHTSYWSGKASDFKGVLVRAILPLTLVATSIFIIGSLKVDRIPNSRKAITTADWRSLEWETYCEGKIEDYSKALINCQNGRSSDKTILVWGDSHARHLISGISELFPNTNIALSYVSGCPPQSGLYGSTHLYSNPKQQSKCKAQNQRLYNALISKKISPDLVLITSRKITNPKLLHIAGDPDKENHLANITNKLLTELNEAGVRTFYAGDFIRPGKTLALCRATPSYILSDSLADKICLPDMKQVNSEIKFAKKMSKVIDRYIPLYQAQCPQDVCKFSTTDGWITHQDHHHFSIPGSIEMMQRAYPILQGAIGNLQEFDPNLEYRKYEFPEKSTDIKAVISCPALSSTSPSFNKAIRFTKSDKNNVWINSNRTSSKISLSENYDHYELKLIGRVEGILSGEYMRGGTKKPINMRGTIKKNDLTMSGKRGPRTCVATFKIPHNINRQN